MSHPEFRLPAEWERQSAILLAWPHESGAWADRLDAIRDEFVVLITAILRHQQVIVLVQPGDRSAATRLGDQAGLHCLEIPFDDTWCRDYGPITLVSSGQRLALDFHFNGWGDKHPAARDNRVNLHLSRHELFNRIPFRQSLFELEGGGIDGDGRGRLLVNWHCLQTRHPHLSRREIRHELCDLLNVDEVIGIDIEPMAGDDTDGHIDTLVRFADTSTLVFQLQADPERNLLLRGQLETLRQLDGQPYRLISLPHAGGFNSDLPANYANFLLINDACLVPAYGVPADEQACAILAELFPGRTIEPVPAQTMISQFGGPHCATMNIPAALG